MNDLDARLAAHYARLAPPAGFDARLAVRLAAEREQVARQDRAAALREALVQHERARATVALAWRRALWRNLALALAGCLLLAFTLPTWQALGAQLAAPGTLSQQEPRGIATLALLTLAGLALALPSRWRAAAWSALTR